MLYVFENLTLLTISQKRKDKEELEKECLCHKKELEIYKEKCNEKNVLIETLKEEYVCLFH